MNDRKTLEYVITIDANSAFKGMTVALNHLIQATEKEKVIEENIYDLYKKYSFQYQNTEDRDIEQDIEQEVVKDEISIVVQSGTGFKPLEEVENFEIIGLGFTNLYDKRSTEQKEKPEMLHIQTHLKVTEGEVYNEAEIRALYNELTGETVQWFQGGWYVSGEDEKHLLEIQDCFYELTYTDKLKHIKPIIEYTTKDIVEEGTWELVVKF